MTKYIKDTGGVSLSFSIITPVYNRADCISRCIKSVIKNRHGNEDLEHIIVDDGSKDNTSEIIQGYSEKYSHINFIRFPQNRGTNAARNAAIKASTGKFCIILDSDDYFVDDAIQRIKNVIQEHPNNKHYLFAPNDMLPKYENNILLKGHKSRTLSFADFLSGSICGDFIHVVCTDIMKQYPFDETLRIYEGVFFMRFYKEAKRILFTKNIVTIRERSRADSVTRDTFRVSTQVIDRTIKATELFILWFKMIVSNWAFCRFYIAITKFWLTICCS